MANADFRVALAWAKPHALDNEGARRFFERLAYRPLSKVFAKRL